MSKCDVEGCEGEFYSLGFCRKHYVRFSRHGTTNSLYDRSNYEPIGGIKDGRPGHRGYLAVNIINDIKYKARSRKKIWALTHSQAFALITGPCHYCGKKPDWPKSRNQIDRMDNFGNYTTNNTVSCCAFCNNSKHGKSYKDFIKYLSK